MKRSRYTGSGPVKRTSKLRDVLATCSIRRNSMAQLNVSVSGEFYEKAKSRRTRTRAALEQSGNQESAIALGAPGRAKTRRIADAGALEKEPENKSFARAAGRIKSRTIAASARSRSSKFTDFGALEKEFEQKSFTRRIKITHAMKRQHRMEGQEGVSNTSKPKSKRTPEREEDHQREDRTWLQRKSLSNPNLEPQARKQPAVTNAIQPQKKRRQDRGEERQQRVSNQPQKKPYPLSDSDSDSESYAQTRTQTLTQRKSKKKQRCVQNLGYKRVKDESIEKFESNAVLNAKPPPRKLQPQFSSESEPGSDSDSDLVSDPPTQAELRMQRKGQQKQRNLNRLDHKQEEQQESAAVKAEPLPVVVDLVSSDSESESESCENDLVLKLTKLLQYEAIGRGADRNEMQFYARRLFKLGLHSKEMILDALNFNSNDLDDIHNATHTNTEMASDIVKEWKWMKPFHKTCFYRWVWSEMQRFRSGTKIYKVFGDEEFSGKVVGYDSDAKLYKILYSDGDKEEMDHNEVRNHTKRRRIKKRRNRY